MKQIVIAIALVAASSSLSSAQERPVPKDSTRLSISGCANGRVFTVGRDPEHESSFVIALGTKVRLEGDKKVLAEVKKHEGSMLEVTGLMKQSDVVQPGVGLAGGKVRITPVMPNTNGRSPGVDPGPPPPILDVESYRLLNASCPSR
jgi:hypothetical protein